MQSESSSSSSDSESATNSESEYEDTGATRMQGLYNQMIQDAPPKQTEVVFRPIQEQGLLGSLASGLGLTEVQAETQQG